MQRLKYLKELFSRPVFKWIGVTITILGAYDLFISQFIQREFQDKFPLISDLFIRIGLSWYVWIIISLVFLLIVFFESSYSYIKSYETPTVLKKLIELRAEGKNLLKGINDCRSLDTVNDWVSKHYVWRERIVKVVEKVDESLADEIKPSEHIEFDDYSDEGWHFYVHPRLRREQTKSNEKLNGIIKEIRNRN